MLIGEYTHSLDSKKRVSLPSKFRKEIGKKIVMTKGLDNCLFVYPMKEWERIAESLNSLPFVHSDNRSFSRFMLSGAVEAEVDSAGRVLIPDFLYEFAELKDKVIIAGVHSRIEIWDEEKWQEYKKQVEKQADTLAEKLGDIGMA